MSLPKMKWNAPIVTEHQLNKKPKKMESSIEEVGITMVQLSAYI